jgi:signal transduction histidine kinase
MHGFASDQAGIGSLQEMTRIFELWTPDGRLLTLDEWPFRRIKRGETLNHLELRLCRLDQGWEKIVSYSGAILESTINERLLFLSVQDLTDQRKAEQSLRESEERLRLLGDHLAASRDEIRALAASLIRAQEEERRRVSRELHDQICHQLGYLASDIGNLAVSPLAPENLRAHLTAIRARVVKTSQETHHIAYQMHTAILKDLGLVASLNALCRQFSDQYPNITANFKSSGPPTSIPIDVATCLYRVAQESLQNTAKHSGAKNVSLRLGFKKWAVVLTIHDNGAGFDPKAVKGHSGIGLISMNERGHSVNGELTITSQPGHGTQITLEIPLPESRV